MSFPERTPHLRRAKLALGVTAACAGIWLAATEPVHAILPPWLQHVVGASTAESAMYRLMKLPGVEALYPRPPKEAQLQLDQLIQGGPNAELYQLRARVSEEALDEVAAERDWKLYAAKAKDPVAAELELADFYHRRLLASQELAALKEVAMAPPQPEDIYADPLQQRSWIAFDRMLALASDQALPPAQTASILDAFVTRYPDQAAVYALAVKFRLDQGDLPAAEGVVKRYREQFPHDDVFPTRAEALIALRGGNADAALAVYDRAFLPLWPPELIHSYFSLLEQAHRQRAFVADQRARLAAHPDGAEALNALARIFYYDQQAGRLDAAQRTLDAFRVDREARHGAWSLQDLFTLASLTSATHSYAESARYHYALASSEGTLPNGEPAAEAGLAGLIRVLLEAPDQQLTLGAQNLTLYHDIATLDQGPGYWNGILSLWLNGTSIQREYNDENTKAQAYFHRAKAAELLADLDRRFPHAVERPALHSQMILVISQYGEPAAVIANGKSFVEEFPTSPERPAVSGLMADAYARLNDSAAEFALYDQELADLAARTKGLPLTAGAALSSATQGVPQDSSVRITLQDPAGRFTDEASTDPLANDAARTGGATLVNPGPLASRPARRSLPEAEAYTRTLDRYLGRLTATGDLPRALTVLRGQLERNPNDPLLYERLSTFLQQNNLSAEQEKVFEQAIAHFQQPTWYDKLARAYLREKKKEDFAALTRRVTDIFSGTDLDAYFANVHPRNPIGPQLALELNLYAAKRFPHDLVFIHNLLTAYQAPGTRNSHAYDLLIRSHWWDSPDLQDEFLAYLSRTGQLEAELASLQALPSDQSNPAVNHELAELDIFTSHFEQAAPLIGSVAELYPADRDKGDQAVSVFRSLAYQDTSGLSRNRAVKFETNLSKADPGNPQFLATLGDLYAEETSSGGEDLVAAAGYFSRIPALHPGSTSGFLASATLFWDYFQFDDALAQLKAARERFHSASLFAYEAGAIEESRQNQSAAVAEYINAVLHPLDNTLKLNSTSAVINAFFKPPSDAADSTLWAAAQSFVGTPEASGRLINLARRKSSAGLIDTSTAKAFAAHPTSSAALELRAKVLAAQHHTPDLNPLLTSLFDDALAHASTFDQAQAVGSLAQARNLTLVYERSLARQAALSQDPIQRIELQYSLARSLEARKDTADAAHVIDSVYQGNQKVLGVVRATTDFYVRTAQPQKAIATLLAAAGAATPALARDFTLEAADRANEADDPAQARRLATALLVQTPYDARVLDLVAVSYTRAQDDAGLKAFYLARLQTAVADPAVTGDARRQNVALLRRGIIPALTRVSDFEGAVNQYIALISAFPEDSATAQEAALYALKYKRESQLLGFLQSTVEHSPQDSRFSVSLARVDTTFGDLRPAEEAYNKAILVRKDRSDLFSARADIELRLSQTDPAQAELAAADFQRLYLLTYHDPSWMVRLAELRARQQRTHDAVQALETAYITGHPKAPSDFFTVAAQLAKWNLLLEARTFAEQGAALAGNDFLVPANPSLDGENSSAGPVVYARVLARLVKADEALQFLASARRAAQISANSPTVLAAELARANVTGEDAKDFQANFAANRSRNADTVLKAATDAIGSTVAAYYTPEQKLAYAQSLDRLHDAAQPNANPDLALEAAASAGLADREAAWRKQRLLNDPLNKADASELQTYTALQQRRLAFKDLAQTLEAYAIRVPRAQRNGIRQQAAQAYRDAGDATAEMRVERSVVLDNDPALRDRFFDLLLRHDRQALAALAGSTNASLADAALNYSVAHAGEADALAAVGRRGQNLPQVWRPASASLVETFFASTNSARASAADFADSLAYDASIASRLASRPDPLQHLTGDNFFSYASRFGIFLATVPKAPGLPEAEDFLPAGLEASPTLPAPYLDLARTYAEAGNNSAALIEYNHVLELAPSDSSAPATHDEMAVMLYRARRKDEALAHWRDALALLLHMQQHAIYPEAFFTSLESVVSHLGQRHLVVGFRPDIDAVIQPYLAKNGNYRSNELLKAVYTASATPQEGASAILTLASSAPDPEGVLRDLTDQPWLEPPAREALLERRLALRQKSAVTGEQEDHSLQSIRRDLLKLYLAGHEDAKAQTLLDSIPATKQPDPALAEARIVLAARSNRLETLLANFRSTPDSAPADSILTSAADTLDKAVPAAQSQKSYPLAHASARALREFVFDHKQLNHSLLPTDFLALAQSRIDTGDLPGAISLLRRLTLEAPHAPEGYLGQTVPDPYANTDAAAVLLERSNHAAEALPFLEALVQLTPWNAAYRLRLAEAEQSTGDLTKATPKLMAVARDASAPYGLRAQAAADLAKAHAAATDLGSAELNLIARPGPPQATRQPYFVLSRLAAARAPGVPPALSDTLAREAISIDASASSDTLLTLLLAQSVTTADPSAALAILRSISAAAPARYPGYDALPAADDTGDAAGNEDPVAADAEVAESDPSGNQGRADSTTPTRSLPASTLDLPTRIRLATQLSILSQRDGDGEAAWGYAELAVMLDSSAPKPDPTLMHRRDELRRSVLLARRNAQRQPLIHATLAQSNQVRPRLTESSTDWEELP